MSHTQDSKVRQRPRFPSLRSLNPATLAQYCLARHPRDSRFYFASVTSSGGRKALGCACGGGKPIFTVKFRDGSKYDLEASDVRFIAPEPGTGSNRSARTADRHSVPARGLNSSRLVVAITATGTQREVKYSLGVRVDSDPPEFYVWFKPEARKPMPSVKDGDRETFRCHIPWNRVIRSKNTREENVDRCSLRFRLRRGDGAVACEANASLADLFLSEGYKLGASTSKGGEVRLVLRGWRGLPDPDAVRACKATVLHAALVAEWGRAWSEKADKHSGPMNAARIGENTAVRDIAERLGRQVHAGAGASQASGAALLRAAADHISPRKAWRDRDRVAALAEQLCRALVTTNVFRCSRGESTTQNIGAIFTPDEKYSFRPSQSVPSADKPRADGKAAPMRDARPETYKYVRRLSSAERKRVRETTRGPVNRGRAYTHVVRRRVKVRAVAHRLDIAPGFLLHDAPLLAARKAGVNLSEKEWLCYAWISRSLDAAAAGAAIASFIRKEGRDFLLNMRDSDPIPEVQGTGTFGLNPRQDVALAKLAPPFTADTEGAAAQGKSAARGSKEGNGGNTQGKYLAKRIYPQYRLDQSMSRVSEQQDRVSVICAAHQVGAALVAGTVNGNVLVWDVYGRCEGSIHLTSSAVTCLVYVPSPNGKDGFVVSGHRDGSLVWTSLHSVSGEDEDEKVDNASVEFYKNDAKQAFPSSREGVTALICGHEGVSLAAAAGMQISVRKAKEPTELSRLTIGPPGPRGRGAPAPDRITCVEYVNREWLAAGTAGGNVHLFVLGAGAMTTPSATVSMGCPVQLLTCLPLLNDEQICEHPQYILDTAVNARGHNLICICQENTSAREGAGSRMSLLRARRGRSGTPGSGASGKLIVELDRKLIDMKDSVRAVELVCDCLVCLHDHGTLVRHNCARGGKFHRESTGVLRLCLDKDSHAPLDIVGFVVRGDVAYTVSANGALMAWPFDAANSGPAGVAVESKSSK